AGGVASVCTVSPRTMTWSFAMSLYCGHAGRPGPFGSPLVMKVTQYDDIMSASLRSTSFHSSGPLLYAWLKTYEISAVCEAPLACGCPLRSGTRVKKYA